MSKTELKVLSFPEFRKKAARKAKWERVVGFFKKLFHRKVGFEKYTVVAWGYYSDVSWTWIDVQNRKTGRVKRHRIESNHVEWEHVKYFVSKLK